MTALETLHLASGAQLAADGVPLHYGDQQREYQAALHNVVVMDRSHEGRFVMTGRDRLNLMQRMSTNDLLTLAANEGRPTLFPNPNGRIIDRATVYNRGESAFIISEPGRSEALRKYLQQNIFFNDQVKLEDVTASTRQFALHGANADALVEKLLNGNVAPEYGLEANIQGVNVFVARRKPVAGSHWVMIVAAEHGAILWQAVIAEGAVPAGSLLYNVLRIRAGRPGAGRELSLEYIPLEIGVWDEVSFSKGCYTGQEIIARMESRRKLARTIVTLKLNAASEAPVKLYVEGRAVGTLTSSVTTPFGEHLGIGVIKVHAAHPNTSLTVGETGNIQAIITSLAGTQPVVTAEEEAAL